jgi:hypothetical protein
LSWEPIDPAVLPARIVAWLETSPGIVRVAVDGAPCTGPDELADALVPLLQSAGRPVAVVRSAMFWRDASLRLEHGREDVESYLSWVDADALRREVLAPAAEHGRYLPSLRDPRTDRSTREAVRVLEPNAVLLVSGALLLGSGLPFDRTVHLTSTPAARARRTPAEQAWTLPAYDIYDRRARPVANADVVVKVDDPRHPAVRGLGGT